MIYIQFGTTASGACTTDHMWPIPTTAFSVIGYTAWVGTDAPC